MEEEIIEKLQEYYNKHITFDIETLENKKGIYIIFKINASIRISDFERGIIRIGFTFNFKYFKELTLDANLWELRRLINKNILYLFEEE